MDDTKITFDSAKAIYRKRSNRTSYDISFGERPKTMEAFHVVT